MQAATEVSRQPPTEKKTDFCAEVAVYSTASACEKRSLKIHVSGLFKGIYLTLNQPKSKYCSACIHVD